ncbi:hypothetical protein BX600DRAFT_90151 [Xylariales sp. PMI_506]|nr:hypothetical protein BX600DRAFT_90151 [Xylariales sp. PMI_506]
MTPPANLGGQPLGRKRRAHRKSRFGCANCKARGVKCDEKKPSCRRCESYGVMCPYASGYSVGKLATAATFKVDVASKPIRSPSAPLPILGSETNSETYQLVPEDVALVELFQRCTTVTLGPKTSRHIYIDKALQIAFSYPFVMHAVLALAHFHGNAFDATTPVGDSKRSFRHWHRAVSLLNKRLDNPIIPAERDAIWLSATLISVGGFSAIAVDTPEEAWPLRSQSPLDLSWLKLCNGKRLVVELTNPLREDSQFREVSAELLATLSQLESIVSAPRKGWEDLPEGFYEIFELSQDPGENPYYKAVIGLLEIYQSKLDPDNFLPCLSFSSILDARFRELLRLKDERAMLILLYWYAKMCDRRLWWIWKHSWTEGLAIYGYLCRAWISLPKLCKLLDGPRVALITASGYVEHHKINKRAATLQGVCLQTKFS